MEPLTKTHVTDAQGPRGLYATSYSWISRATHATACAWISPYEVGCVVSYSECDVAQLEKETACKCCRQRTP
jgi:hypothetical protein